VPVGHHRRGTPKIARRDAARRKTALKKILKLAEAVQKVAITSLVAPSCRTSSSV